MRKIVLLAVMAVIMSACGKTEKNENEFANDMENVKFWGGPTAVVKGLAHSGSYACKLDSVNIYSYGFQSVFENIGKKIPKKVNITLWVYSMQPDPDATIVIAVNSNGQSKYWQNTGMVGIAKAKEWTEISASFDLPANLDIKDELSVFVWNPNKRELYLDDFKVSFLK